MADMSDWILGAVAAGFVAWSFAVFRAIGAVGMLANRVAALELDKRSHSDLPWHTEAGTRIRLIEDRINRLEEISHRKDDDHD